MRRETQVRDATGLLLEKYGYNENGDAISAHLPIRYGYAGRWQKERDPDTGLQCSRLSNGSLILQSRPAGRKDHASAEPRHDDLLGYSRTVRGRGQSVRVCLGAG
jgi:hypothetical protein